MTGDRAALRRGSAITIVVSIAYTIAAWALPDIAVFSPPIGTRAVLEIGSFFLVFMAAVMLAIPDVEDSRPARNAFIAALAIIALTNAVFGIAATFDGEDLTPDEGLALYPWVASRYAAGVLFILAGLERPRASLVRYLALPLVAVGVVDGVLLANAERLPRLVDVATDGGTLAVRATDIGTLAVLQAVPAVLFLVGVWMAGRLYLRSNAPVFLFLSLSLIAQIFTQLHQIARPAFLGPIITSADVFRTACFVLLFVGALLQLRAVYDERAATVRAQQGDLLAHDVLTEELVRALDREEDFRAIVSHELATPVATIRAFVHVLRSSIEHPSRRAEESLEGIGTEARRLGQFIDRIDELRQLERDDFRCELRPARIGPLLDEASRFVRGLPGHHPSYVHYDDVRLAVDPVRFGQALRNVLANAAQYSPPGTPIEIRGRRVEGSYLVSVSDQGPGVPEGERAAVLRRYARGKAGKQVRGAGLGLYVASRVAEAHGGSIRFADGLPLGRGATVVIELPLDVGLPGTG